MTSIQINQLGPFQIREELRHDAFSATYLAFDSKQKQTLALRILNPEFGGNPLYARQFILAGQAAAPLYQENIVQVYKAGEIEGRYYIASELITGQTLLTVLIRRQKLFSPTEVTSILQQIASGLDYIHSQGLLYRDLSFRDILLSETGHATLTDIGMGELRHASMAPSGADGQAEPASGISAFTSPEQARGDAQIDHRSDIYSLGVIGYALLAGRLPFEATDPAVLKHEIIEQAPPDPISLNPHIPAHVANILTTVLAKEPDKRYVSAGLFARVLTRSLLWETNAEVLALLAGDPEPAEVEPQPRSKRGLVIFALALLAVIAILAGTLFARPALLNQLATLGFIDNSDPSTPQSLDSTFQPSVAVTATQTIASNALAQAATTTTKSSMIAPVEEITATLAATPVIANADTPMPTVLATTTVTAALVSTSTSITAPVEANAMQAANTSAVEAPESITPTLVTTITNSITSPVTITPPVSLSAVATVEPTDTAAPTIAPTDTDTPMPTATAIATNLPVSTNTPQPTNTLTPAPTATAIATSTNTALPTATETATVLPTSTNTATPLPTNTSTPLPTNTSTPLPTNTSTPLPTNTSTPLPTNTSTLLPTNTSTPLPTNTSTPLPTNTSTPLPTNTSTPLPRATSTSLPIATTTNTPLPSATPTFAATSTLIPTQSATLTRLPTATATRTPVPPSVDLTTLRQPVNDGTARLRGTGQPGSTIQVVVNDVIAGTTVIRPNGAWTLAVVLGKAGSYQLGVRAVYANGKVIQATTRQITVIVPAPTPIPSPTITSGSIQLAAPAENAGGSGLEEFQWTANFTPDSGLGFEVIFWKAGQDPLVSGFGLAAPTTKNKINVDLNALDATLGNLLEPGDYKWGVLLVRASPYQRVQFLGQSHNYRFSRGGSDNGGGSSSGGGQTSGE